MGKAGEHSSAVSLSLSSEATEFKGVKSKMDERKNKKEEENSQIEISAENVEN